MIERIFRLEVYNALKTSFRGLCRSGGGHVSCASITRPDQGTIGKYGNVNYPELFPPVDVVVDLAKDTGDVGLIRAMADLCGFILIAKPPVSGDPKWLAHMGAAAKEAGDVVSGIAEALADDGQVTAEESRRLELRRQVREALEAFAQMDKALEELEKPEGA